MNLKAAFQVFFNAHVHSQKFKIIQNLKKVLVTLTNIQNNSKGIYKLCPGYSLSCLMGNNFMGLDFSVLTRMNMKNTQHDHSLLWIFKRLDFTK